VDLPGPVLAALQAQMGARRAAIDGGAAHVGWKVARSIPGVEDYLGFDGTVFGYLTSSTVLAPDSSYRIADAAEPCAETEFAVQLGRDLLPNASTTAVSMAIAGIGVALELVDVGVGTGMHDVIAQDVFHRAVAFGPTREVAALPADAQAWLRVNGELRETVPATTQLAETVALMARLLDGLGEQLLAGDRIICGSLTHVRVEPGDQVTAEIAGLGSVSLALS
jgi:2-keto-4-pentenoate hydratase